MAFTRHGRPPPTAIARAESAAAQGSGRPRALNSGRALGAPPSAHPDSTPSSPMPARRTRGTAPRPGSRPTRRRSSRRATARGGGAGRSWLISEQVAHLVGKSCDDLLGRGHARDEVPALPRTAAPGPHLGLGESPATAGASMAFRGGHGFSFPARSSSRSRSSSRHRAHSDSARAMDESRSFSATASIPRRPSMVFAPSLR